MRRPSALLAAVTVVAVPLVAGCGNDPAKPPDVRTPSTARATLGELDGEAGLRFSTPDGWRKTEGRDPLVLTLTSGTATIAIWRYPRTEPLPRTGPDIEAALKALVSAAKARDGTFTPEQTARAKVDGQPAVVILGSQTIAGTPQRFRSVHVYAFGAELVIDSYAPGGDFERLNDTIFRRFTRSVKLFKPKA